jgi:hypothetical protein
MKPTFDHSVNVLVAAFFNETLVHGHPCGCAFGNLVAHKLGLKVHRVDDDSAAWTKNNSYADHSAFDWYQAIAPGKVHSGNPLKGAEQIYSVGYTISEAAMIEEAFERPTRTNLCTVRIGTEEDVFEGLMNVIDVLADIHGIDLTVKEEAKKLFVKV